MNYDAHPSLERYWPSERRAILTHKYFMGTALGRDPDLSDVIDDWETNHAHRWREEKIRRDAQAQIREIEAFRKEQSVERGYEVQFTDAAREWVERREEAWREMWEETALAGA